MAIRITVPVYEPDGCTESTCVCHPTLVVVPACGVAFVLQSTSCPNVVVPAHLLLENLLVVPVQGVVLFVVYPKKPELLFALPDGDDHVAGLAFVPVNPLI